MAAVGHRLVHGGDDPAFMHPTRINEGVLRELRGIQQLAPLHTAANLTGVESVTKLFSEDVPQYPPSPSLPPFLPSSLPPFLPSSLPPFLPSSLPPFLPSSLPPFLPSSLSPFLPFSLFPFLPSSLPLLLSRFLLFSLLSSSCYITLMI